MDFSKATKKDIENLVQNYKSVKAKYGIDLRKQEETTKKLTEEKRKKPNAMNQMLLFQYLRDEIKPLLEKFEEKEREVVRQYFRYLSEQKTITQGFKLR
jgi:hypothetical protein